MKGARRQRRLFMTWIGSGWFRQLCPMVALLFFVEGLAAATGGLPRPPVALDLGVATAEAEEGGGGWLTATVAADFHDAAIQEQLATLEPGVESAAAFVAREIGFEAYTGSLRGARGTLWSGAGNSLDQASLLIALLRGQGIGARYVRGSLGEAEVEALIASMFDAERLASAVGYVPPGWLRSDPLHDPELAATLADHWWVELEDGSQIDPAFADGLPRGTAETRYFELPNGVRHTVTLRLQADLQGFLGLDETETPLEHTFDTAAVYGRPITLGHFINVQQPPQIINLGLKSYTYSPYLAVGDGDGNPDNDRLIRGRDYVEQFGLFGLVNATLTRLTLEMEVDDPGRAPALYHRVLLDRIGFAARHGGGAPVAVASDAPALSEYDQTVLYITPGFLAPEAVAPLQAARADLADRLAPLTPVVAGLAEVEPATLSGADRADLQAYTTLTRRLLGAGGAVVAAAFLLDSDSYTRTMRASHLTLAYYDSPRLTLFEARTHGEGADSALSLGLDLRRNGIHAIPYPGQNLFNRLGFNLVKGHWDALLEHGTVDHLLGGEGHPGASAAAVFKAAEEQGVPILSLHGEAAISGRLEGMPLSDEARARIGSALRTGKLVNLPAAPVTVAGRPAIAWYEVDAATGEMVGVAEDGGHQSMLEFALISALVGVGGLFTITTLGHNVTDLFSGEHKAIEDYHPYDPTNLNSTTLNSVEALTRMATEETILGINVGFATDGSASSGVEGQEVNLRPELDDLYTVLDAVGGSGSVIDFAGSDTEVLSLYAPGPSDRHGERVAAPGVTLEVVPDPAFTTKAGESPLPTAFRARITNTGNDGAFRLTATPPEGWELLTAREVSPIPAGVTGEVSLYLRPLPGTSLPAPGAPLDFAVTVTREAAAAGAVVASAVGVESGLTLAVAFTMPPVHRLRLTAAPEGLDAAPDGTASTTLTLTNAGNVEEGVDLTVDLPDGVTAGPLPAHLDLAPGESATPTLALTAHGLPLATGHTAAATATYGDLEASVTLPLHIAAPGALPALAGATAAATLGRDGLAETLRSLGDDLGRLYETPASDLARDRVVSGIATLTPLLDDPLLAPFAAGLTAAGAAVAGAAPAETAAALDHLGPPLTALAERLGHLAAHDVEVALRPNTAEALPETPTPFSLYLRNRGSETTTYHLRLEGIPSGIDATLSRTEITLPPGMAIAPGVSGDDLLDVAVEATLTQPAHELTAFNFRVVATPEGAPEIARTARGRFTARDEQVGVVAVEVEPPFVDPGTPVHLAARLLNAVNRDRSILVAAVVRGADGSVVATLPARAARLTVLASLDTIDLGTLETGALALGSYRVEVAVSEADGTPIPGATAGATLLLGSPVTATLTASPAVVPPGEGEVEVRLVVAATLDAEGGDPLLGVRETAGTGRTVAVRGGYAYVGGTEGVSVLDVHDPRNPQLVHTFESPGENRISIDGDRLLVAHGRDLHLYDLTDPLHPDPIATAAGGVTGTHPTHLAVHGDLAVINTAIFGWSGSTLLFVRGDALLFDVSDPAAPRPLGLLFDTPQSFHPEWPGSDFWIGEDSAATGTTLYLPSASAPGSGAGGVGRLRILDVTSPDTVAEVAHLDLPGTALLHAVAVSGERALVAGSTGPFSIQGGTPLASGDLTLHLLDLHDPRHPTILGSTTLDDVATSRYHRLSLTAGPDHRFVLNGATVAGEPVVRLVEAGDPTHIEVADLPATALVADSDLDAGLLYTASTSGLAIYDLGALLGVAVGARIDLPDDGSADPLAGSFSEPPAATLAGVEADTLVWPLTLTAAHPSHTVTWQSRLPGLQPGEVRDVAIGGTVEFTTGGATSTLALAPVVVAVEQILALAPAAAEARPGAAAAYSLTVSNPTATGVTYTLAVEGVPEAWVALPPSVEVAAGGRAQVPLTLRAEPFAAAGDHGFAVVAATAAGVRGEVHGDLILSGAPVAETARHGVVAALIPLQPTAGQGSEATYRVRLTNTGNTTATFDLSGIWPDGLTGRFGTTAVEVAPGADNYREVPLTVALPARHDPATLPFTVTASDPRAPGVADEAEAQVAISTYGVAVAIAPERGGAGDLYHLTVRNTGRRRDTFDLAVGGLAAPAATLAVAEVTLDPGAAQELPLTVGDLDFALPGATDLTVVATSRGDRAVAGHATAEVAVATRHGVEVAFEPAAAELEGPGSATLLLRVRNTGNVEAVYGAAITATGGPLTASLRSLAGGHTQRIDSFHLPPLASGILAVDATLSTAGKGSVSATVTAVDQPGLSASDTATVVAGGLPPAAAVPPVADAGEDLHAGVGRRVTLDGSGSYDPAGRLITYRWQVAATPKGSGVTTGDLVGAATPDPHLTPDVAGTYRLELVVTADGEESEVDAVEITAVSGNVPPDARAGRDRRGRTGVAAVVDATASRDADGDPLTFTWRFAQLPPGSGLDDPALDGRTAATASFVPDVAGTYLLVVAVSDGRATDEAEVAIVAAEAEVAPVADAGTDRAGTVDEAVRLDGGGSYDPDGDPLTFTWSFVSLPAGSRLTDADIEAAATATPLFVPDVAGAYVVRLRLSDSMQASFDNVMVVVTEALPPAAVRVVELHGRGGSGGIGGVELLLLLAWLVWRRRLRTAALVLLLVLPHPAAAGEWYLGGGVGYAHTRTSSGRLESDLAARGHTAAVTLDNDEVGWRLLAGYRPSPYWGMEATYVDLEEVTSRVRATTDDPQALVEETSAVHPFSVQGLSLAPVVRLPVGERLALEVTGGLFYWEAEVHADFNLPGAPSANRNEEGLNWLFGAGATYDLSHRVALRLGWQRYRTDRDDVDLVGLDLLYRFP